jgi:hypothetical protein
MTTTITSVYALPTSPFQGSGLVGIVITPGVPCYFKLEGTGLDHITNVMWYPLNAASVEFEMRQLILVDDTLGTFIDRAGRLSFRLDTGDVITFPVRTYGPVSYQPLWTSPYEGLNTG